jgi:hypothetical protein
MRAIKYLIPLSLFFIFFIWALAGNYHYFYSVYYPDFFIVLFPVLFLFSIPGVAYNFKKIFPFFERWGFIIFPLLAFASTLYINFFVFYNIPRVQDEINMKFMAEAILQGRLSSPIHPHYEFFNYLYMIPSLNGTYSIFQPGFPFLLAPFLFFKIPFMLNPLLTAGSVFFLGKLSLDLYDRKTATLSMFLVSTSVFLISMGGTLMSHSLTAFATLGAIYFCNRGLSGSFRKNTIYALLFIVAIMFTRPQNGIFVLIPMVFLVLVKTDLKFTLRYSFFIFLFLLPFLAALYYSDSVFSGELGKPKHVDYFQYSEPENDCMGLGFYKGCRRSTWRELPEEGLTPQFAFEVTAMRLFQLVVFLFFHPVMMLFIIILFLFRTQKEEFLNDSMLLVSFAATFGAYFFYYFDGNVYGPRYYYEVSFFLVPLVARGLIYSGNQNRFNFSNPLLQISNILIILVLSGTIFQYAFAVPTLNKIHRAAFWGSDPLLKKSVEEWGMENSVVFIDPHLYYSSGVAIMNMADIDSNNIIYALDFGDVSNQRLANYYSGRTFFRAHFDKEWYEYKPPVIIPLHYDSNKNPEKITVKMYEKAYPVDGVPDYCGYYPAWDYLDKYSGFTVSKEFLGNRKVLFCRFSDYSQHYTFGQNFESEGIYSVKVIGVSVPEGVEFEMVSENLFLDMDFHGKVNGHKVFDTKFYFKKGFNLITIKPKQKVVPEGGYFVIDSIIFEKLK